MQNIVTTNTEKQLISKLKHIRTYTILYIVQHIKMKMYASLDRKLEKYKYNL
jgi:hypothetical protein